MWRLASTKKSWSLWRIRHWLICLCCYNLSLPGWNPFFEDFQKCWEMELGISVFFGRSLWIWSQPWLRWWKMTKVDSSWFLQNWLNFDLKIFEQKMSRGSTQANMARDHNDEVAAAAIRALGDFGQEGATTLATCKTAFNVGKSCLWERVADPNSLDRWQILSWSKFLSVFREHVGSKKRAISSVPLFDGHYWWSTSIAISPELPENPFPIGGSENGPKFTNLHDQRTLGWFSWIYPEAPNTWALWPVDSIAAVRFVWRLWLGVNMSSLLDVSSVEDLRQKIQYIVYDRFDEHLWTSQAVIAWFVHIFSRFSKSHGFEQVRWSNLKRKDSKEVVNEEGKFLPTCFVWLVSKSSPALFCWNMWKTAFPPFQLANEATALAQFGPLALPYGETLATCLDRRLDEASKAAVIAAIGAVQAEQHAGLLVVPWFWVVGGLGSGHFFP